MFLAEYSYEEDISAQREEAFEDGFEKGEITGLNKGLKQGIQQGIQQGIEQGIQQGIIDTAKKMLKDKLPFETISNYTGLTEEIKKLI